MKKRTRTPQPALNSLNYWQDQLKGCTPVLNFPYDFPRTDTKTRIVEKESFQLLAGISSDLRKISENEGISLFSIGLTVFGILIYKYSGDNDINIGTGTVNPLVLRLKIDEDTSIRNLLRTTHKVIQNAIAHQDLPFDDVIGIVSPKPVTGMNPAYQIAFHWNDNPAETENMHNREKKATDITFSLHEAGETIAGSIEYNSGLIKQATITRLQDNYKNLAAKLGYILNSTVSSVSVVCENELKLLEEFNNKVTPLPYNLAHEFFEDQVKLTPQKRAIKCRNESLSYDELNKRINQLANHLISMGIKPGEIVGICLDRSNEIVISIFAVVKAGGCYLPLDPALPPDRFNFMFEDSDAKILITHSSLLKKFQKELKNLVVILDEDQSSIRNRSTLNPAPDISSQSPVYMIYTSGSTGKPKGVIVHHQSVVNLINSISKRPGITKNDRMLSVTTHSFDISVLEVFLPLSFGAEQIMAESDEILDGQKLLGLLEENDITLLSTTPAVWNILLYCGWQGKKNLMAFCGGEALLPGLVKDLIPKVKSLWNLYGPTETTVYSTGFQITDPEAPVLIGSPVDNTKIYILDKNNNQLPIGVIGEVSIGGMGVSKGYYKQNELTAKKFIKINKDETVYKTGDLGRFLPDGNIELLGRNDYQIKIRGYRIEPGEIENVFSLIQGVKEAVVKVQRFDNYDDRLVAFLNIDNTFSLSREQIIDTLGKYLPQYMIPAFIKLLNEFPRMPNSKINRNALLIEHGEIEQDPICESVSLTTTQNLLVQIWQSILKVKKVNLTDNFFDMGGNSLLAISFLNKMEENLHKRIPYKDFRTNPTIENLSRYIDENPVIQHLTADLIHAENKNDLPLSQNQSRIWLSTKLNPSRVNYNLSFTYHLSGPLDVGLFQQSITALFQRHHILFSSIAERNGVPYIDLKQSGGKIEILDYSEAPPEVRESEIFDFINNDSRRISDLKNEPLYRLYLFISSVQDFYFYFTIHHVVFDGWSWKVFINDLSQIYNDLLSDNEVLLKEPQYQQYDFALLEKNQDKTKNLDNSVSFWKTVLKDSSPVLNFPYDIPRSVINTGYGDREFINFPPDVSARLRMISKNEGISLFSTMLTTFGILMHKYSGDYDLNIGTPLANRSLTSMEPIIGMFVNTVVIRLKFDQQITFKSLLKSTNAFILDAIAHQDLSFEKIVEIVNPERVADINPVFQVAFAWDDNLDIPLNLNGISSSKVFMHGGTSTFDITCSLLDNGQTIQGDIEYNTDLIKQDTILRLRDHYLKLVSNLIEDSDAPIASIPLILEEEKTRIFQFSGTPSPYPADKTIAQLFDQEVEKHPNNIAVVYKNNSLTYAELNSRSNQLARMLIGKGVAKNKVVGLLADKSIDLITGILGILKAGGIYLPLDTDYPPERINYMIRDSDCRIILTQTKHLGIPLTVVERICIDSPASYQNNDHDILNEVTSNDLAYIMYTSGTTGKPKGTMIRQKSVVRLVRNTNYININQEDRLLLTGAIVFDATTFEIWGALLNGASLYIPDKEEILDPRLLGEILFKNEITILWLTSALFTQIAENRADIFGKLKYLLAGGDVLSPPHINKVRKNNPKLTVINGYGPTENTTFTTCYHIERDFVHNIPIGKPVSNTTVYIFDKNFNLQPVGVIGELFTGGDGLSIGYINRDDLNKTRFIDHPFIKGDKLYRTGDFVKWLPDGNIEFHGRIDNQIKIRGFRVELAEIESVISEIAGVIEVVVKTFRISENDTRLVAFVNVAETFRMNPGDIQSYLKMKMPSFMVPSVIKLMHGFKLTVNGKIDREALKFATDDIKEVDKLSLSPTEERIHKIWCDILKLRNISPEDNFFEIGGNSLLSISVLSKIESEFKLEPGLRLFFDHPRIRDFSAFIDNSLKSIDKSQSEVLEEKSKSKIIKGEI